MAQVEVGDATLHAEADGSGEPVTVLAHGLTNSCREMRMFTPFLPGTNVRFCFRGHGHSSAPDSGYRFADFARDLDAIAYAYRATRAIGTSLGAGAICNLLAREPDRFERLIFLLPAGLDLPFELKDQFLRTAELLETLPREEAIDQLMANPDRIEDYAQAPWVRDLAREMWEDVNVEGVARAIREVIEDYPVPDREMLRAVRAPTMIISRDGDPIHPLVVGEILAEVMPNAELLAYRDDDELIEAIPSLVERAREFLS